VCKKPCCVHVFHNPCLCLDFMGPSLLLFQFLPVFLHGGGVLTYIYIYIYMYLYIYIQCIVFPVRYELNLCMLCRRK
jgi:hypothetical protein